MLIESTWYNHWAGKVNQEKSTITENIINAHSLMRKRRTRSHVIAEMAANHFERYALKCGFSLERNQHDYGLDGGLNTYKRNGEPEEGFVHVQFKASEHIKYNKNDTFTSFPVEQAHLSQWLCEPFPVILILHDVSIEKSYWVYVQRYFELIHGFSLDEKQKTYTVRFPINQVVDERAMRMFARFKNSVLNQLDGVISHVRDDNI
jgi:hypothetical protein